MSPLADGLLNIDLAKQFECQFVIVAANRLGVIHQTLATCAAAEHCSLKPSGMFLCQVNQETDGSENTNAEQIAKYTDIPILGSVSYQGQAEQVARIDELLAVEGRPEQGA
jgi:dethiobiotin synthetase